MTLPRKSNRRGSLLILGAMALSPLLPSGALAQTASTPVVTGVSAAGTARGSAAGVAPAGSIAVGGTGASASGVPSTGASASDPAQLGGGAPPSPGSAPAAGTGEGGGYTVRLRSLEKNVNELKEQIFRTKARLNLLKETVLGGTLGASRAVIHHKNEMGNSYRLIKAIYALDGVQIFSKADDTGRLAEMPEFDVYNGAIQPGSHTLTVMLVYQGNGSVFSYLKGYKMTVHSSHTFVAGEAKSTAINVVGYEKGNITTNLQDRPAVDFRINVVAVEAPGGTTSTANATNKK